MIALRNSRHRTGSGAARSAKCVAIPSQLKLRRFHSLSFLHPFGVKASYEPVLMNNGWITFERAYGKD